MQGLPDAVSDFWEDNKDWLIPILEFGKNLATRAGAIALVGAVCSTGAGCGLATVLIAGAVGGAGADVAGEKVLDCMNGDGCMEFPLEGLAWDSAEGAFLGTTGAGLSYHAAWSLKYQEAVVSFRALVVDPNYGPAVAIETVAVQCFRGSIEG